MRRLALFSLLLPACTSPKDDTGDSTPIDSGDTAETADTAETGETGETGDSDDTAPPPPVLLQVVVYDTDLEDREIAYTAQDARGQLLQDASFLRGQDVLVFTDLRDDYASQGLFSALATEYGHRTNIVGDTTAGWYQSVNYRTDADRSGGVALMSRYDIDEPVQYIFETRGCGEEANANLGFAYVNLDVDGRYAHVLVTRLAPDAEGCADGEAAAAREAQLAEIAAWIDTAGVPAAETFVIAGSFGIDRFGPEYATLQAFPGFREPAYAGHDAVSDPTINNFAALSFRDAPGAPSWTDYAWDAHATAPFWHNLVVPFRADEWWENVTFVSDEYSGSFPVFAFPYANELTPTRSTHARYYDHVTLRSVATGRYVTVGADPDGYLTIDADAPSEAAWFDLANGSAPTPDQTCIETGTLRVEIAADLAWYWNIDSLGFLNGAWTTPSDQLGIEIASGDCLEDGSLVAFTRDGTSGRTYGTPTSGGEGTYLAFSATELTEAELFEVTLDTTPAEDWSAELTYAP